MSRLTNNKGLDLSVAVWLAHSTYDLESRENLISVTTLLKPIRQTILASRLPEEAKVTDVYDLFKSQLGNAIHDAIERSWKEGYAASLGRLGIPENVVNKFRINPKQDEPDTLPVYTEIRAEKQVGKFTISGKFDISLTGHLRDIKSTNVFVYQNGGHTDKWVMQGSMYRWLSPGIIQHDDFIVQYILLDWNSGTAGRDPNYPTHALPVRSFTLKSLQETERWVQNQLSLLEKYFNAPESELPECSDEDLWRTDPVYKYYSDPAATGRSTKNFDNLNDAMMHKANKGKGRVDTVPGQVKACLYCEAYSLCTQKDRLIEEGSLRP